MATNKAPKIKEKNINDKEDDEDDIPTEERNSGWSLLVGKEGWKHKSLKGVDASMSIVMGFMVVGVSMLMR